MTGKELTARLPSTPLLALWVLPLVGLAAFLAGLWLEPQRTWVDLLVVGNYLVGVGLSGVLLVALHYVTGARWSIPLTRVYEAMTAILLPAAIVLVVVLALRPSLYSWAASPSHIGSESLLQHWWLNRPFFLARSVVYLALWIGFAVAIVRNSRRQDADNDAGPTRRNIRLSAMFLVVFGITVWLSSYDWIMSLDPEWASTVFGVYSFSSLFLSGLAACILLVVWLRRSLSLETVFSDDLLHDLGTLLFAFSSFWMYAWFCQYMLIWYVNIPEETVYLRQRQQGGWLGVLLLDLALNWAVPFAVLLFRSAKRNPRILSIIALIVLAGRWVDLYVMTFPSLPTVAPAFGFIEVGLILGTTGLFLAAVMRALGRAALIPLQQPVVGE